MSKLTDKQVAERYKAMLLVIAETMEEDDFMTATAHLIRRKIDEVEAL